MPVANTTGLDTKRFDLKTLPEAYVIIRRMTYGEYLDRRESASRMYLKGMGKGEEMEGSMQLVNRKVVEMEFASCIVEHNLEYQNKDGSTRPYDFKNGKDVERLDPRIGDEIAKYIDEMNQFTEEEEGN